MDTAPLPESVVYFESLVHDRVVPPMAMPVVAALADAVAEAPYARYETEQSVENSQKCASLRLDDETGQLEVC